MSSSLLDLALALRNLIRQRRRAGFAAAAVAFGVIAMVLAGGFNEWSFWNLRESTIQSHLGHIQIVRPGYRDGGQADPFGYLLPQASSEKAAIERSPDVKITGERLSFTGLISHGDNTISFLAEGVEPDKEHILSRYLQIIMGDELSMGDPTGIIVGKGLAEQLGVGVGATVVLMANTATGGINAVECRVRGIFQTVTKAYDDTALRVPLKKTHELLRTTGSHVWVVLLNRTEDTERVSRAFASQFGGQPLQIQAWRELADFYNKAVELFAKQLAVVKVIISLIIVLSISNTLMMTVMERTGEIGTSMALGLTRAKILRMFVLEGTMLGVVGGLLGLAVALALAQIISLVGIPLPPAPGMDLTVIGRIHVTWPIAIEATTLAVVTTLLASIYPSWKASRMNIVDALRFNR